MALPTAVAALQEAPFACFEDEEVDAVALGNTHAFGAPPSSRGLPTHAVAMPGSKTLPARSVARVARSLECTGSGTFYFQNEALKHRFICWRITKNTLVLREWSLHTSLEGNGLRLQFPAPVVASGVAAFESWDAQSIVISVLTHAGSIHRLAFPIPSVPSKNARSSASILQPQATSGKSTSAPSVFPRAPNFKAATDIVHSLQTDEDITTAMWVNEYNLIVATDTGRIIGVNFGLPSAPEHTPQEFLFTDESMMQWLWKGLVKTGSQRRRLGNDDLSAESIVAMSFFPFDSDALNDDQEDEGTTTEVDDVCILTLSADFTLRAWSFRNQTCLGKQSIRNHARSTNPEDDSGDETGVDDLDDDSAVFATHAKLVAIPSATSGACRILVHVESTEEYPQQIVLLRGEIGRAPNAATQLGLEVARVFSIGNKDKQRLKFVDFAVERGHLYSAWRSAIGDFVYSHPNPMALTGPRVIAGHLVSSIDVQMKKYDREDHELPFQVTDDEGSRRLIDLFYVERVLLPGRFSRQSLYKAISESQGGLDTPLRAYFTQAGPQESRYKELLFAVIASRTTATGSHNHNLQRVAAWKNLLDLCTKHWRSEVAPIGFACIAPPTADQLLGSPVLLRRNRVSLFFPSATSIAAAMLSKGVTNSSAATNATHDSIAELLPAFDAFPSRGFQAAVQNGVTSVLTGEDWQVESLLGLARQAVRSSMQASGPTDVAPELLLTRALLRLSQALAHGHAAPLAILQELVERLSPANVASGESSEDPFAVNSDSEEPNDDDEYVAMNGDASTAKQTRFFGAIETAYAFSQATARTVDELCAQSLRVVLCLAHLVDARPSFMEPATLRAIERALLPKAIVVYQRWSQSRWLANQNITSTSEVELLSAKTSGTVLPPLLQFFLAEANDSLNRVAPFQRARAVADMHAFDASEDPHQLVGSFASGVLELVSRPNDLLVGFLQKKREYSILRSMLSCSLNDLSLHSDTTMSSALKTAIRVKYMRSIGECLAWEGHQAAKHSESSSATVASEYFKQAIRCFNMCLSSYVAQIEAASDGVGERDFQRAVDHCERFVGTAVRLLKETIPRALYPLLLGFLWVLATEALELVEAKPLQSFVWVNIFKYSVEEQRFQDAHLALMRTVQLSPSIAPGFASTMAKQDGDDDSDSQEDQDIARTAVECTSFFVKELCRHNRLDLVCDLQWGALEPEVERQIQWLAANANVLTEGGGSSIDAAVVLHHQLLYAYYARRQQPANAAGAMHALFLRLRLATAATKSMAALRMQRNALLAAVTVLRDVARDENRWIVRKLHAEELPPHSTSLNIVTLQDMEKDLAVLDGKLRLVHAGGHEHSVLLGAMDASAVVALLVDAALRATSTQHKTTLAERKQQSLASLELAAHIAATHALGYDHVTKSLARHCVATTPGEQDGLAWELLKTFLRFVDQLLQFELAAHELLSWHTAGKIVLPAWLTQRMASGNPAKLVLLYLTHGLLIEAAAAAAAMVPVDLLREGEAAFRKRSSAPSAALPWLPYNLFDSVLAAADHALTMDRTLEGDPGLRAAVQTLRTRLSDYFKYVHRLEQARVAASVARDSYDAL